MRAPAVVLCLAFTLSTSLSAQPTGFVAVDLGGAAMRGGVDPTAFRTAWGGVRIGGLLGPGRGLALDVGMSGVGGSNAFCTYTAGLEVRAWSRARVSPFVRAEAGFLDSWDDREGTARQDLFLLTGLGGGLAIRVGPRMACRVGLTFHGHGAWEEGHYGPVVAYGGVEFRW